MKKHKKLLISVAVIIVVAALGGTYVWHVKAAKADGNSSTSGQKVNLAPPTQADTERDEANKQRIVDESQNGGSSSSGQTSNKKSVTPVISYAGVYDGSVQVGSYVPGVFENGGTCTATFTNGSKTVVKTTQGTTNSNSVSCPAITAQPSEFTPKGSWNVVVSYDSATATGSSSQTSIQIN